MPRMGEEKGAVRFRTDRTKFELQSVRLLNYPSQALCNGIILSNLRVCFRGIRQ